MIRKILRNMYKCNVSKRNRRKTVVLENGTVIPGSWLLWKKYQNSNRKVVA